MGTDIHSNGSKWAGEEPDTLDRLVEVLGTYTLDGAFFPFVTVRANKQEWSIGGNFVDVSHVFRITTTDESVVKRLVAAIGSNPGYRVALEAHRALFAAGGGQ